MREGPPSTETNDGFPSTIWSQIRVGGDSDRRRQAFESLAVRYERPIRVWLRAALARDEDEAREFTQDFLLWVLESGFLAKADPRLGRFRAFLKTALRHYVTDSRRRDQALKRGGGARVESLAGDEDGPRELPDARGSTPEEELDAAWRADLVRVALERVEEQLRSSGRERAFALFHEYFIEPEEGTDYASLATRHGVSKVDVSNALARTKNLYRSQLKSLVMDSVQSAEDLDEELGWLFGKERT